MHAKIGSPRPWRGHSALHGACDSVVKTDLAIGMRNCDALWHYARLDAIDLPRRAAVTATHHRGAPRPKAQHEVVNDRLKLPPLGRHLPHPTRQGPIELDDRISRVRVGPQAWGCCADNDAVGEQAGSIDHRIAMAADLNSGRLAYALRHRRPVCLSRACASPRTQSWLRSSAKCRFANARPEPVFRYRSNRPAVLASANSSTTTTDHGRCWTVTPDGPELCQASRRVTSLVRPT